MDWGKQNRLSRLFRDDSKCFYLPIDHGYFLGPTCSLEKPGQTIAPLLPYADALLDPDGMVLATNDDHSSEDETLRGTDSRIRNVFVSTPGEYTIEIRGYQGSGGPFTLTIAVLQ